MPSAVITASSSGDNTIVAAVAGYAIRVLGYVLTFSAAVNAQWHSDLSSSVVAISGLHYGIGTGPVAIVVPDMSFGSRGWFQTAAGKALNLKLSGAVAVGGVLVYELVSG